VAASREIPHERKPNLHIACIRMLSGVFEIKKSLSWYHQCNALVVGNSRVMWARYHESLIR